MVVTLSDKSGSDASPEGRPTHDAMAALVAALILVPALAVLTYFHERWDDKQGDWLMLGAAIMLSLFLPLLAYSYFFYRQERKRIEVERVFEKLGLPKDSAYEQMFKVARSGPYFLLAAGMAWAVAVVGLMILFVGESIGINTISYTEIRNERFPIEGSRLVFGMAFLGAYFWGLQYVLRRYVANDLIPGVFYGLGLRMPLAATLALLIFNAFASFTGGGTVDGAAADAAGSASAGVDARIWPALAFLLGAFPQRAQQWLMARIPGFSAEADPSVRPLPVDMIEGIRTYDRMRLEELGIESCHDLATADFIPLILRTSYGARELADWILQAKLCVYCGQSVRDLREHGVRTILDLVDLEVDDIADLAKKTSASDMGLKRAQEFAKTDPEIQRLRSVAQKLSQYTVLEPPSRRKTT